LYPARGNGRGKSARKKTRGLVAEKTEASKIWDLHVAVRQTKHKSPEVQLGGATF